ncbi:hypothetical protein [Methylobacterium sp. J-090]|uniref:hypothetical protein n=1 Tax=Methylobacterium sp. J-090 TaxID=2836666 RepID=UPI001FB88B07|nr:hypothetical protein [Methylobacterium sp. J-090]MCJ2080723.1 hypothetical protein [Methylobacterium sp. J-090]
MSAPMVIPCSTEVGLPEWRGALLAKAIEQTAHIIGPICPFALARDFQDHLRLPDEACWEEITATLYMMVRTGLYTSNTYDVATGRFILGAGTLLTASPALISFLTRSPEDGAI